MLDWIRYSGCNITLKLNPFHWRIHAELYRSADMWEEDAFIIELLPITIRVWIDDGSW